MKVAEFDSAQLKCIVMHVSGGKAEQWFPVNQPVLVAMMQQFSLVKNVLFQASLSPSPPSMAVFWAEFKQQHHDVSMPYMVQLAELGLMIPVNTACCERGFSTYNIIKSKLRNQLKIMQIDSFIWLYSVPVTEIKKVA